MIVGQVVSPDEVANSLQYLYDDRKLLKELGEKSAAKFSRDEYMWETIAKRWLKEFEEGINDTNGTMALNNSDKSGNN